MSDLTEVGKTFDLSDEVVGPHGRTYTQVKAHVDKVRKTEGWLTLCDDMRASHEARNTKVDGREDARAVVIMSTTPVVMSEYIGGEGWGPEHLLQAYLAVPEGRA